MVIAKSCGVTLVCATLAIQLQCAESSLIKRLSERCYDAKDEKEDKRRVLKKAPKTLDSRRNIMHTKMCKRMFVSCI